MTSYVTPKKNAAFIFYAGLPSVASTSIFQSSATIAAGDFKVSIDGGALNNLATLPVVTPGSSKMVKFSLSADEMNGDNITVVGSDAAGGEWKDILVNIQTSARQIDDLCYPTTTGRSLDVTATGAAGIDWGNVENLTTTNALTNTTVATVTTTTTATNVTTVNGLAAGVITAASIAADAIGASELAADAITEIRSLASGTSDSGTTTTMVDAARTEADTDYWKGQIIVFTSGNIVGQARLITGFNAGTDTITYAPATTQAAGTHTYEIWPNSAVDVQQWLQTTVSTPATAGIPDVNVKNIDNDAASASGTVTFPNATLASTTNITAGTITTATNVTTVNGLAANVITAAATASDFGAELATAIWTDTTAGDFTVAASIGKSVMNGVALGTGLTINAYTGNTVQTGDSFARIGLAGAGLTNIDLPNQTMDIVGNITGNLSGSVGSVTAGVTLAASAVQAIWDALTSALTTAGSIGKLLVDNINATISSRMATYTQPTGFLAATFPTTVASTTNITGGTITTVTNLTNAPTSGDLTATMKASVNTEVLDVLNVDTFAEPAQGTPPATTTLANKIAYLYKAWRNKTTQTATTYNLFNDDAATVDHKATTSDDTVTFTKTEMTSGP